MDFHHGKGFQVDVRAALLQSANHLQKIIERQIGVQAADNMKFRGTLADALLGTLVNFFKGVGVSAG